MNAKQSLKFLQKFHSYKNRLLAFSHKQQLHSLIGSRCLRPKADSYKRPTSDKVRLCTPARSLDTIHTERLATCCTRKCTCRASDLLSCAIEMHFFRRQFPCAAQLKVQLPLCAAHIQVQLPFTSMCIFEYYEPHFCKKHCHMSQSCPS